MVTSKLRTALRQSRRLLTIAVLALPAIAAAQQPPPGYYFSAGAELPDSACEALADGLFRTTIERVGRNAAQFKMIGLAERLFPDTATITRTLPPAPSSRPALPPSLLSPAARWWWSPSDMHLPFAVTATAVEYYRKKLHELSAKQHPFDRRNAAAPQRGSFSYYAKVDTTTRYPEAAHVVRLSIYWSDYCGPLCALRFEHHRDVYFRADGTVLRVDGDSRPSTVAS